MVEPMPQPPVAAARPHRWDFSGNQWDDPYAWLEDPSDPDVIAYLDAENAYRETVLAPTKQLQETLYQEMLGRIKQTDSSVPAKHGDWFYYTRTEAGLQHKILARKRGSLDAAEEVLLDLNAMVGKSGFIRLDAWEPSPDHRWLAYRLNESGGLEGTVFIKDLTSGEILPERLSPAGWNLAWTNDSTALYYARQDATLRPFELCRHRIGEDPAADVLLYREEDQIFNLELAKANDRSYIFLTSASMDSSEVRYLPADSPMAELRLFAPRRPDILYFLDHVDDEFLVLTNERARNFKLLAVPVAEPAAAPRELIPHRADVLLQELAVFASGIAIFGREAGFSQLSLLDRRTLDLRRVPFDEEVYTVHAGENPEYDAGTVRVAYSSLVTPWSVYDVNLETGERTLLKRDEIPSGHDPERYVTERRFATAADGTSIPISLVRRRDAPSGPGPLLLYGYGSYGFSIEPWFNPSRFSLLDRDVTFAIAHIRGGQELGRHWYEDGRLLKKMNTFTDFIDAADHLVAVGLTRPDQLIIMGGSAGGLLMGAVTNLRPDLARAVVAEVPFVDVMRVMLDPSLPLTAGEFVEWGDPSDPAAYDYMRAYSPYDNVERTAYPEMLITGGIEDDQVQYWQPAKWIAKLRTRSTSGQPLFLRVNMGAGHSGSSGRYDNLRERAHDYAFMLRAWELSREA
ncbi:MAG: S9 family peptidase [Chloroflexota bacterium]|nr:S9 family peptidase [Chloroflexota bacterium]